MKKYFLPIFFFLSIFTIFSLPHEKVFADISDGHITEDTTIGPEGNPYNFPNTEIYISPGITLTILPGTNLNFAGFYNEGTLNVAGTEMDRINLNDMSYFGTQFSTVNLDYVDMAGPDISFSNEGTLFLNHSNISIIDDYAIITWNSFASTHISNSHISGGGVSVEQGTPLFIDHSTIFNAYEYALSGDGGSVLTISDTTLDGGLDGIVLFNGSSLDADHVTIKNQTDAGVESILNYGLIKIKNSEIYSNNIGIYPNTGESVDISNNSIHDNTFLGVEVDGAPSLDFSNNWWGSPTGPTHSSNPLGTGDEVSDYVNFLPYLPTDPLIVPPPTKDPIILIPGIMGTELNKNYGDFGNIWTNIAQLLIPGQDSFLNDLSLNVDGTEDSNFPISLGDIIRHVLVGPVDNHVFDLLISKLQNDGYVEGTNLFVFPYDWRKDNSESAILLKNKIDAVLAQTGKTKVDVIAHSMGGLVAKKYIADNGGGNIDQLIFIGTPHLGAPKAFKALMYGDDMGFNVFSHKIHILNPNRIKVISQNMPSAYELLPSRKYVDTNSNKYVTDLVTQYLSGVGNNNYLLNYDDTNTFLASQGRNSSMLPIADNFHSSIDSLDLSGVNTYNFASCGLETIGSITAKKEKKTTSLGISIGKDYKLSYTNGDETVPLLSSVGPYTNKFYIKRSSHSTLPSATGVPETISAILAGVSLPTFSNIITNINPCFVSGRVVSVHSPVSLNIYDSQNNHTGLDENGDIEYGIDGVAYDEIEDTKYAFLPDGMDYKVVTRATDTGTYDFYVEEIASDETKTKEYYWNEIPLQSLNTNAKIDILNGTENYVVNLDEDGDGVFEKTLLPNASLNSLESSDTIPPQTNVSFSNQFLTLSATDENSGVLKTEYSTDEKNWHTYSTPFSVNGIVYYFSTDKAGNIESIKNVEILKPQSSSGHSNGVVIVTSNAPLESFTEPKKEIEKSIKTPEIFSEIKDKKVELSLINKKIKDIENKSIGEDKEEVASKNLTASVINSDFDPKPLVAIVLIGFLGFGAFLIRKYLLK